MSIEIIPAIMVNKYKDLVSHANRIVNLVSWVQIDVMDGRFTDSISWPYTKGSKYFEDILNGNEGLPHWEDLNYSVDLMVNDPYTEAPKWLAAGVSRIIIHWGSLFKIKENRANKNPVDLINTLIQGGVEVCIAKAPHDDIFEIEEFLSNFSNGEISSIQFMGIDRVGYQGEPFVESVFDDVEKFHKKHPEIKISIDGGINLETAKEFAKLGVSRLVSGSFIFSNEDGVKEAIQKLKEVTEK